MFLDDPAASTPPRRVVGERRATADATVSQATRSFAIDCEFIKVRQGKGETLQTWEVTVSVGVVSEELETILYARVQAPPRTQVFDDAFARTQGKLEPDWTLGVRLEVAQVRPTARCSRNLSKRSPRYSRDTAEISPRDSRGTAETPPRTSRGVAQALVRGLLEDGQSLLVGWQIAKDLEGLRLGEL